MKLLKFNHELKCFKYLSYELIYTYMSCIGVAFLYYTSYIGFDNFVYAIEQINYYSDGIIFSENILIQDIENSPKYIANMIMSFVMSFFDGSWTEAAILIIRFNYILYGIAGAYIACKFLERYKTIIGILITIILMQELTVSLGFDTNSAGDVFLGTAIPVAIIALAGIVGTGKESWNYTWILLSISTLLHVHEGIWAGCIVGIIWFGKCISKKKILLKEIMLLPVYVITMLIVVLPSLLSGEEVNGEAFVEIYAFYRTPHHMLLTDWGLSAILAMGAFLFIPFFTICVKYIPKVKESNNLEAKEIIINTFLICLFWGILLIIQYVGVELLKNDILVSMYLPKCFKYIAIIGAIWYIKLGYDFFIEKKYLLSVIFLVTPFLNTFWEQSIYIIFIGTISIFTVVIYELYYRKFKQTEIRNEYYDIIAWLAVAAVYLLYENENSIVMVFYILAIAFTYIFLSNRSKRNKIIFALILILLILNCLENRIYIDSENGKEYLSGDKTMQLTVGEDLWELSKEFSEITTENEEFLASPYSKNANILQTISERGCYVLYKNLPTSKELTFEWFDRVNETETVQTGTPEEIKSLMEDIEIEYVYLEDEQAEQAISSGLFDVVVEENNLVILKLK